MKVHHTGYLVQDIKKSEAKFAALGFIPKGEVVFDGYRKVRIIFLKNGSHTVELIEPVGEESPIYGLMKKYRNSPYHICYEVADLSEAIKYFTENGAMLISPAEYAPAIDPEKKVAFLMDPDIGIFELLEAYE